jgi:hypothetical protein
VYNNTLFNIPDRSEALHLRNGASEQNTLNSNTLIGMNGQSISLDEELEITEVEEQNASRISLSDEEGLDTGYTTSNNGDEVEESTGSNNDSGDGSDESDCNNDGETTGNLRSGIISLMHEKNESVMTI